MRETRILDALGKIDDCFLEELYQDEQKPRKKFRFSILLVAAVLISSLAMTALAVENRRNTENWFHRFLSGGEDAQTVEQLTDSQQAILGQGLVEINQSVTRNGYTVTLESGISDGYRALLKFRIDGPEGTVLDGKDYGLSIHTNIDWPDPENESFGIGFASGRMLEDGDPNDHSILFLQEYCFQPPEDSDFSLTDGTTWIIVIDDFRSYGKAENRVIAEGPWEFTVRFADDLLVTNSVEMLKKPAKCSARRSIRGHWLDLDVKVTSFQLRTISASVFVKRPLTGFWEGILLDPIRLVMKDGSTLEAHWQMSVNRGRYEESFLLFDRPVSFEDVAYVEFSRK